MDEKEISFCPDNLSSTETKQKHEAKLGSEVDRSDDGNKTYKRNHVHNIWDVRFIFIGKKEFTPTVRSLNFDGGVVFPDFFKSSVGDGGNIFGEARVLVFPNVAVLVAFTTLIV